MRFHMNGQTGLTMGQVHKNLQFDYNTNYEREQALEYIRIQEKINAKRRIEAETNPQRKAEMEELYDDGHYNFDFYFGEDPRFMD